MSRQQNIAIAQKVLEGIGSGQDPTRIAALFDTDHLFEVQSDVGALLWIGRRTGRLAIAHLMTQYRRLVT